MSSENVELVKRAYAAMEAGDVEAAIGLCATDCELFSIFSDAEGRTYRGHDGVSDLGEARAALGSGA